MKRPSLFTKERVALFAAEIVVVVVGILIAFQVEEWRDRHVSDLLGALPSGQPTAVVPGPRRCHLTARLL